MKKSSKRVKTSSGDKSAPASLPEILRDLPDVLAMDIGTGTKDILHFSARNTIENNLKLVVPTPARLMAERLLRESGPLSIAGYTMGGGFLAQVLREHREKGLPVSMERLPAFTVRNNLEEVRESGIEVVEKIAAPTHFFDEIELPLYFDLMNRFGIDTDRLAVVAISVQDHGYHTNDESSRRNRFKYFLEHLEADHTPRALVFSPATLPGVFGRLHSGALSVAHFNPNLKVILVDTSFSAILGCTFDSRAAALPGPVLYINFGNGHTMATVVNSGRIQAFFEHHTRLLKDKPRAMLDFMKRLTEGHLTTDEVFDDDGNGCVTYEPQPFSNISGIVVTGPKRALMAETGLGPFIEAAPGGDMMMTGPLGLLRGLALLEGKASA
ncbi:MAG: hypothetical protein HQM09_16615 [Candidatus Riflebacteria bacterium]|nr:hypothetical protein [Candidatus Riflebacteria bacterium]